MAQRVKNTCNKGFVLNLKMHYCFQTPDWLSKMILLPTWRTLFYKLAEDYPDCLMLNFTIKVSLLSYMLVPNGQIIKVRQRFSSDNSNGSLAFVTSFHAFVI